MSRSLFATFLLPTAALLVAGVFLRSTPAHAQEKTPPESVNIVTADGVKLKALFYPSATKRAPTVIMLHPIGDGKGMRAPEWKNLAEKLQASKYSVIMFDFRGHGDSTSVGEKFWNYKPNQAYVRTKDKETIDVKNYIKQGSAYLPILVNDIAAVRAYLDRRNDDTQDCNSSSLIVIGADTGATLGALWINSEWYRYKFTPDPKFLPAFEVKKLSNYSECAGNDIIGAVFLTIQPAFEKRPISVTGLLKTASKDKAMAAAFFYGKSDTKAANFAKTLEKNLKTKNSNKHAYIGAVELNTDLKGIKLLQKGLNTDKAIVDYLDSVTEERKNERVDKDFPNTNYRWKMLNGISFPAREKKGDKTLLFDDYGKFIPQ